MCDRLPVTSLQRQAAPVTNFFSHTMSLARTTCLQLQSFQATKPRQPNLITISHRVHIVSCELKSFSINFHRTSLQSHIWAHKNRPRVICKSSNQGNYNERRSFPCRSLTRLPSQVFGFVRKNFLPSVLLSAVLLGLAFPEHGQRVFGIGLSKYATFGMFFISGLMLETQELSNAMESWPYLIFGLVSVLFLTPLLSTVVFWIPMVPRELVTGLALFCCVPTTLSSGVSLTQLAGANTAMALSLTVISNILGILTVPFMVSKLVARGLGISMPVGPLMTSLMLTLVAALLLGKVCRECVPGLGSIVDKRKEMLAIICSFCLSLVPWMQVSCAKDSLLTLKIGSLVSIAFIGMVIHIVFLLSNIIGVEGLGMLNDNKEHKSISWAIVLPASQKTLPIAIAVIGSIGGLMGEDGLLVLPCLIAHITQILLDSLLVRMWIQGDINKARIAS